MFDGCTLGHADRWAGCFRAARLVPAAGRRVAAATVRLGTDWRGIGVYWEAIDEDISVASLLHPENFVRLPGKALPPTRRTARSRAASGRKRAVRG